MMNHYFIKVLAVLGCILVDLSPQCSAGQSSSRIKPERSIPPLEESILYIECEDYDLWTDALKPFEKARNEQFDPFKVTTEEIIALVNLRKAPISFKHSLVEHTINNNPENSFVKWLKARFYIQERVGTLRDSQNKELSKVQLKEVRKKEQEVLKEVKNMIEIEKEIHAALKNPRPKSISTA